MGLGSAISTGMARLLMQDIEIVFMKLCISDALLLQDLQQAAAPNVKDALIWLCT